MKKFLYTILIWLWAVSLAFPATYFVSQNGSGNGADVDHPDSVSDFNGGVFGQLDGDTVYFLGTITSAVNPPDSGSSGNYVVLRGDYPGHACTITYAGKQMELSNVSYIEVTGFTFSGADNGPALEVHNASNYAYIHDNDFQAQSVATDEADERNTIQTANSNYGRIIDNTFAEGGGHYFILEAYNSFYWVNRGNIFTQSNSRTQSYQINDGTINIGGTAGYVLSENNITTVQSGANAYAGGIHITSAQHCIYRKNINNNTPNNFSLYGTDHEYNMVYNNTNYNVSEISQGYFLFTDAGGTKRYDRIINNIVTGYPDYAIHSYTTDEVSNMTFLNNMLVKSGTYDVYWKGSTYTVASLSQPHTMADGSYFAGNISTAPTFTDAANGDFTADDGNAPQVDAGAWLATVKTTTFGTTIYLNETPYMFYDGWNIPGETGDVIKTENGQTATITSINYGAKTLTVSSATPVTAGEGVFLNYQGGAPDIGAEEYGGTPPPLDIGIENPSPGNGASGVSLTQDLGWTNGGDVTDVDVYFDDTDCTTQVVDGVDTETYDTGTMDTSTTYYWKVVVNPDTDNISFPSSGCYTFTTVGTPANIPAIVQNDGGPIFKQNDGGPIYSPN